MRRASCLWAAALIALASVVPGSVLAAADDATSATAAVRGQTVTVRVHACVSGADQHKVSIGLPSELQFSATRPTVTSPGRASARLAGHRLTVAFADAAPFGTCLDARLEGVATKPGVIHTSVDVGGKAVPLSYRVAPPGHGKPRIAVLPGIDRCQRSACRTFVAAMPNGPQPPSTLVVLPLANGRIDCQGIYTELARLGPTGTLRRAEPWVLSRQCTADRLLVRTTKTWPAALFRVQVPVVGDAPAAKVVWSSAGEQQAAIYAPTENRVHVVLPRWTRDEAQHKQAVSEQSSAGRRALIVLGVLAGLGLIALLVWRRRQHRTTGDSPLEGRRIAYTPATSTAGDEPSSEGVPPVTQHAEETAASEAPAGSDPLTTAMASITTLRRQAEELLAEAGSIRARAVREAEGIVSQAVASAEQLLRDSKAGASRAEADATQRAQELVDSAQVEADAARRLAQDAHERAKGAAELADRDLQTVSDEATAARTRLGEDLDVRRDELLAQLERSWQQQRSLLEQRTREQFEQTAAEMQAWRDRYVAEVKNAWEQRLADVEKIAGALGKTFASSGSALTEALAGLTRLREQAGLDDPGLTSAQEPTALPPTTTPDRPAAVEPPVPSPASGPDEQPRRRGLFR